MAVEIDGITITNAAQAKALEAQGFISAEELEKALPNLDSGKLNLRKIIDVHERNSPTTLIGKVVKKVREKINL